MKRIIPIFLCLTLLLCLPAALAGCGTTPTPADDGSVTVICTNYAALELTRGVLETYVSNGGQGRVELSLLGKPGQDMHSFEPTAKDIISLAGADVVVSTGAESWLEAALQSSGNRTVRVVSMMEACDVYAAEHDHDHDHDYDHDHDDAGCAIVDGDEHVWLSLDYATRIVRAINDAVRAVDTENADAWNQSAEQYNAALTALLDEYKDMMKTAVQDTVVVADRNPFVYLFRDLGLNCVAAFPGCSSETSASFETRMKLIETVRAEGLSYIFIMEGSDGKVAEVVATETGAHILTLQSLQVVADGEVTYLEAMRQNLENLKKALQ